MLFEEESEGEGDDTYKNMDSMAINENLNKFLKKVDTHLELEKALIDDWKDRKFN